MTKTVSPRDADPKPVYLVVGEDDALVAAEVRVVLDEVIGSRDPSLVVEEHGADAQSDIDIGSIVDAYTTPPFLIDRRVVVVRDCGRLNADDAARLTAAFDPPPPGAVLILAAGRGALPKALRTAVSAAGEIIDVSTHRSSDKKSYVAEHLRAGPVRLNASAQAALRAHVGDDLSRINGLLDTLASAYGSGVTVDASMLSPFLGAQGTVPVYELTDAIDRGEIDKALGVVHRMMGPGGTSGHEILAALDGHFSKVARLSGADLTSSEEASSVLGVASFPAQKLLGLSRTLDADAVRSALSLVADADLDLKGMTGLSEQMVVEILVARLARLVRAQVR